MNIFYISIPKWIWGRCERLPSATLLLRRTSQDGSQCHIDSVGQCDKIEIFIFIGCFFFSPIVKHVWYVGLPSTFFVRLPTYIYRWVESCGSRRRQHISRRRLSTLSNLRNRYFECCVLGSYAIEWSTVDVLFSKIDYLRHAYINRGSAFAEYTGQRRDYPGVFFPFHPDEDYYFGRVFRLNGRLNWIRLSEKRFSTRTADVDCATIIRLTAHVVPKAIIT